MSISGKLKWSMDDDYAYLEYSEDMDSFTIDTVWVPAAYRNKGIGTKLITHLLVMVDAMSKQVKLTARPIGNYSEERLQRLINYYHQFGFQMKSREHTHAYLARESQVNTLPHLSNTQEVISKIKTSSLNH